MISAGRAAAVVAIVLSGATLQACEPCFGVVGCEGEGQPAVEGRLVTTESGGSVGGAVITLVRTAPGRTDSAFTTTDAAGIFALRIDQPSTPEDKLTLRVKPAGFGGYIIDSLPCAYSRRPGEGCVLGAIVAIPRLPVYQLFSRLTGEPAGGVRVSFKRTRGAPFYGKEATDSVSVTTTKDGFFDLFQPGVFANSLDPIIGDLTVDLPAPTGRTVRPDFNVRPMYRFASYNSAERLGLIAAGPTLNYWAVFVDSITGLRAAGVEVEFRRTGGVATLRDSVRKQSDENGIVDFLPAPLTTGTVAGTLRIRSPRAASAVDLGSIEAQTFDADSAIVFARWLVGATGKLYPLPRTGTP